MKSNFRIDYTFTIVGRCVVQADSRDDAMRKFNAHPPLPKNSKRVPGSGGITHVEEVSILRRDVNE